MSKTPAVNPEVNDIADRAKYAYATATQRLATMQYHSLNWPAPVGSTPTSR